MNLNALLALQGGTDMSSLSGLGSLAGLGGLDGINSDFSVSLNNALQGIQGNSVTNLESIFDKAASTYGVPENLLKAVARAESNFNIKAVSPAGAQGIMQLMPSTQKSYGVKDPFNAEENIMAGAKILSEYMKKYNGNINLTLAAYNAGPGAVAKYNGVPPYKETQNYIKKITGYLTDNYNLSNIAVDGTISRYNPMKASSKIFSSYEDYQKSLKSDANISKIFTNMASNTVIGSTSSSNDWVSSVNSVLMQMLISNMTEE